MRLMYDKARRIFAQIPLHRDDRFAVTARAPYAMSNRVTNGQQFDAVTEDRCICKTTGSLFACSRLRWSSRDVLRASKNVLCAVLPQVRRCPPFLAAGQHRYYKALRLVASLGDSSTNTGFYVDGASFGPSRFISPLLDLCCLRSRGLFCAIPARIPANLMPSPTGGAA